MSVSEDLIDFEIIENQKENIQSLPGGRSARGLANLFSPLHAQPTPTDTSNLNNAVRQEYEAELLTISVSTIGDALSSGFAYVPQLHSIRVSPEQW